MRCPTLLSWSSGKDSAWALHVLRQAADVEVVGLITTIHEQTHRVAMHGVRIELVKAQAQAVDLPLHVVPLPWPCSNSEYEARMRTFLCEAASRGIQSLAFGDLFLPEIRAYREQLLTGTGIVPLFPLWSLPEETTRLARIMLEAGLRAKLTTIDLSRLEKSFAGCEFDGSLLERLPEGIDPCGENGEFHTFCYDGPMFPQRIPIRLSEVVVHQGYCYADLHLVTTASQADRPALRPAV